MNVKNFKLEVTIDNWKSEEIHSESNKNSDTQFACINIQCEKFNAVFISKPDKNRFTSTSASWEV